MLRSSPMPMDVLLWMNPLDIVYEVYKTNVGKY